MKYDRKEDANFIRWAAAIKKRDHYTCQICERRGVELNSHHLDGWDWCKEERYSLDNGVTLCSDCHHRFHSAYGYSENTKVQFDEFVKVSEMIIGKLRNKNKVQDTADHIIADLKEKLSSDK